MSSFMCPLCRENITVGAHRCPMAKQTNKGVKEPVEVGAKVEVNNLTCERYLNGSCGLCVGVMMGDQCHRIIVKFDPPRQHLEPMSFKEQNVFVRTATMIPTVNNIEIGSFVVARGLQMDAELNGKKGEVIGKQFSKDGSVCTMVDFPLPWGKMLLRTENCEPISESRRTSNFTTGISIRLDLPETEIETEPQNELLSSSCKETKQISSSTIPQTDTTAEVSNPTSVASSNSQMSSSLMAGLTMTMKTAENRDVEESKQSGAGLSIVLPGPASPKRDPVAVATKQVDESEPRTPVSEPANAQGRQPFTGRRRTRKSTITAGGIRTTKKEIEQSETNTTIGTPTSATCSLSLDSSFRAARPRPSVGVINFPSISLSNTSTPISTPGSTSLDPSLCSTPLEGKLRAKKRSRNSTRMSSKMSFALVEETPTKDAEISSAAQLATTECKQRPKENAFSFTSTSHQTTTEISETNEGAFSFTSTTPSSVSVPPAESGSAFSFTSVKPVASSVDLVTEGSSIKARFHPAGERLQLELQQRMASTQQLIETTVATKQAVGTTKQDEISEALEGVREWLKKVATHENEFLRSLEKWNRTRELQSVSKISIAKYSPEHFDNRRKAIEAKKEIIKKNISEIETDIEEHRGTQRGLQEVMQQRVEQMEDKLRVTSSELDDLAAEERSFESRIRDVRDRLILKDGERRNIEGEILLLASKKRESEKKTKITMLTTIQKIDDLELEMLRENNKLSEKVRIRESNVVKMEEMKAKVTTLDEFQQNVRNEIEACRSSFADRCRLKSIYKNKIPEIRIIDLDRDVHNRNKKLQIANSKLESAKHQYERQQQELQYFYEDNSKLLDDDLSELESQKKEAASQRNFKLASAIKSEIESAQKIKLRADEFKQKIEEAQQKISQSHLLLDDANTDLSHAQDAFKAAPILRILIQTKLHQQLLLNDPKMPDRSLVDELIYKGDTYNEEDHFLSGLQAEASKLWERALNGDNQT